MKSRHKPATVDQANQGSQGLPLPAEAVQLAAAAVTLNGTQAGAPVAPEAKATAVPSALGRAAKLLKKDEDELSDDRVVKDESPVEGDAEAAVVLAQAPAAPASDDKAAAPVQTDGQAAKSVELSPVLLGLGGLALAAAAGGGGAPHRLPPPCPQPRC